MLHTRDCMWLSSLFFLISVDLVPLRDIAGWRSWRKLQPADDDDDIHLDNTRIVSVMVTFGRSAGAPLGGLLADSLGWRGCVRWIHLQTLAHRFDVAPSSIRPPWRYSHFCSSGGDYQTISIPPTQKPHHLHRMPKLPSYDVSTFSAPFCSRLLSLPFSSFSTY